MKVLVLNSGSSSLKYQLIETNTETVLAKGLAERIGVAGGGGKIKFESEKAGKIELDALMVDHDSAMDKVFSLLTDPEKGAVDSINEIAAVGHRVVHGGEKFVQPEVVDADTLKGIDAMSALAPLHNPPNLTGIKACMRLMPEIPQVAVFDTAFHATMPDYAYTYALPYEYYTDMGIRRYGFHGTSHKFVTIQAMKMLEWRGISPAETRIVTCHLGNGCSMAAVKAGKVVDTSMGMTPAEGLVMGTRSGDLDPAILLHMARVQKLSPDDVDNIINKKSGLLGVSGVTSDMRDVEAGAARGDARAQLALSMFCYRIRKYIGAYAAAMGGLDAVVFTGGIGENDYHVRALCCKDMEFLGMEIDLEKNHSETAMTDLSTDQAKVRVLLVPTNEELMIAREAVEVLHK